MEGRVADNKLGPDDDRVSGAGGGEAGQLIEQAAGCLFAYFFTRIIDGSKLGLDDPRDGLIVKTYYSDVFGHPETTFFQCLQEYGGKKVIGREDPIGADIHVEYLAGGADGGSFTEVVDHQQGRVECQPVIRQCLLISFKAAGIDVTAEVRRDMHDTAASLSGEVGGGLITCFYIIDNHPGTVGIIFHTVKKDDGDPFLNEGVEVVHLLRVECEGGDESVHSFMKEVMGVGGLFAVGLR